VRPASLRPKTVSNINWRGDLILAGEPQTSLNISISQPEVLNRWRAAECRIYPIGAETPCNEKQGQAMEKESGERRLHNPRGATEILPFICDPSSSLPCNHDRKWLWMVADVTGSHVQSLKPPTSQRCTFLFVAIVLVDFLAEPC
jgi:hypothetical protein